MRSAILLAFVALYGCATAPGYRSSSVRPPQAFRETTGDPQPATPSPEGPHPLSPSPVGRGGTKDEPPVSADYWDQLSDTTLSRLVGEVLRGNLDVRSARARVRAARSTLPSNGSTRGAAAHSIRSALRRSSARRSPRFPPVRLR